MPWRGWQISFQFSLSIQSCHLPRCVSRQAVFSSQLSLICFSDQGQLCYFLWLFRKIIQPEPLNTFISWILKHPNSAVPKTKGSLPEGYLITPLDFITVKAWIQTHVRKSTQFWVWAVLRLAMTGNSKLLSSTTKFHTISRIRGFHQVQIGSN